MERNAELLLCEARINCLEVKSLASDYDIRFSGIRRLVGVSAQDRLRRAHVCVLGVGGVGSWTVEALARTGIGTLTLIDLDEVCVSNINRQLPALTFEVGKPKVQVMKTRVEGINPECNVHTIEQFFTPASADELLSGGYDYVIDAIDTLENKALLIVRAREKAIPIITIGGAGGRRDPTAVRVTDLAFTFNDRLLQKLRKTLRTDHGFPPRGNVPFGVDAVYSPEAPMFPHQDGTVCNRREEGAATRLNCEGGYGTASFVTGTFGFVAAAHVVNRLTEQRSE
jgi:tRNA A37 threonylcarbamoyladenosine dehydratase